MCVLLYGHKAAQKDRIGNYKQFIKVSAFVTVLIKSYCYEHGTVSIFEKSKRTATSLGWGGVGGGEGQT